MYWDGLLLHSEDSAFVGAELGSSGLRIRRNSVLEKES